MSSPCLDTIDNPIEDCPYTGQKQASEEYPTGLLSPGMGQVISRKESRCGPFPESGTPTSSVYDNHTYDANGNLTSVEVPGITELASYTWNGENRLASAAKNGVSESYAYDADGNRVKKVSGGVTTRTFFPGVYEETVSGSTTTAIKHYSFNGLIIATRKGTTLSYVHSDHLGSSSVETSASGASTASRTYYAYGSTRSSSGTLQTDRTYTGQKQDGTGLLYMNARYYDSTLGVFLSPDTLVPDAGRVVDYNRFLYVRGNPLKYNDPSGHYSNEEIMQHYGCEDWVCVEAFFHNDGAYAGMWGWLYILQMAQDGDRLTATYGWTGNSLQGVFQRSQRGSIDLRVSDSWVWPSAVFAFHPANGRFAGNYSLNAGSGDAVFTAVGTKHQFRVTPSQIDQTEAGLGFLKAGTDFGPQLAKSPNPYAATAGLLWTAAGAASTVYSDFVVPIQEATQKNPGPTVDLIVDALLEVAAVRIEARSKPYISPAIDASRALWPALCWGTQCFGR